MFDLFEERIPTHLAMPGGDDDEEDDKNDDDSSGSSPSGS